MTRAARAVRGNAPGERPRTVTSRYAYGKAVRGNPGKEKEPMQTNQEGASPAVSPVKLTACEQDPPGKIQCNRVNKAVRSLLFHRDIYIAVTGTEGKPDTYRRSIMADVACLQTRNPRAVELYNEVAERHGCTVTQKNASQFAKDLAEAVKKARDAAPEVFNLTSQAEERESQERAVVSNREREEHQERASVAVAGIMAKRPPDAAALIVAELHVDDSDSMTDYFAHHTERTVAIGWRTGARESFPQLRKAAASFPETAHLGPDADGKVEHRENYSMGSGNYLKDGHSDSSGWAVRSYTIGDGGKVSAYGPVMDDGLPVPGKPAASVVQECDGYSFLETTNKRGPFVLVVPAAREDRATFETRRASAKAAGGWYSRRWGKAPGGFGFDDRATAEQWARGQWGMPDPGPEDVGKCQRDCTEPDPEREGQDRYIREQEGLPAECETTHPDTGNPTRSAAFAEGGCTEPDPEREGQDRYIREQEEIPRGYCTQPDEDRAPDTTWDGTLATIDDPVSCVTFAHLLAYLQETKRVAEVREFEDGGALVRAEESSGFYCLHDNGGEVNVSPLQGQREGDEGPGLDSIPTSWCSDLYSAWEVVRAVLDSMDRQGRGMGTRGGDVVFPLPPDLTDDKEE